MTGPIRVRMGLHTGTPLAGDEGYVGVDVHRAARIAAAAHGGQVVVSSSTASLVDAELRDLGEHRFKDLAAPERVYQLGDGDFPALRSLQRTNLPVPATPFLGRDRELAEVARAPGSGRRPPRHADGTRRHREDAPRAPGRRLGRGGLPGRRHLGAAVPAP